VVKTISPTVKGVVVIAQGGDRLAVRQNIIEAIQVLFDVDMNKITVVKMKNNHQ
jgi:stage III sporulation protein AG